MLGSTMPDTGQTLQPKPLRIAKILRYLVGSFCLCVIMFPLFANAIGVGGNSGSGPLRAVSLLASLLILVVVAADRKGHVTAKIALAIAASVICFCFCECVWRIKLLNHPLNFRVTPEAYTEFDRQHGERQKPDMTYWKTFIEDGKVVFGTVVHKSNADRLGGKTTIAEYEQRDLKVLVFGDSFSHWVQMGSTWPDILESELTDRIGQSVGVLNFARGGYGVTQMLTLAAEKVPQHTPDLVIIAAIGDDFSRARWWHKTVEWNGYTRWMMSSRPDIFLDTPYAKDTGIVNPAATQAWAERMLAGAGTAEDDAVLDAVLQQYSLLRKQNDRIRGTFNPFSLTTSYLYTQLSRGTAIENRSALPRLEWDDYAADETLVPDIQLLRNSPCPILLVFLPEKQEIVQAEVLTTDQNHNLMRSLERLMNNQFVLLQKETDLEAPEKMDLKPYDVHPNISGLTWYAQAIAPFAESLLSKKAATD